MCCFAKAVQSVANTRIFSRLTDQGTQFLVYQMDFRSVNLNAMILPLPIALPAREEGVKFISLEGYSRFFADLDRGFPELPKPYEKSIVPESTRSAVDSQLQVHEVGDYVASFVPQVDDFSRLDPQFVIGKDAWAKIPEYSDYGYAVFQLKSLSGTVHPIAMEFPTRWEDRVFFPTVHIHDGEVHEVEHFDHTLYMQHPNWDKSVGAYAGPKSKDRATGFVRSKLNAANYINGEKCSGIVQPNQLLHRTILKGTLPNRDKIAEVTLQAITSSPLSWINPFSFGCATIASSLGWLVWRRERMRRERFRREVVD